jgi:predicted RNA methylase
MSKSLSAINDLLYVKKLKYAQEINIYAAMPQDVQYPMPIFADTIMWGCAYLSGQVLCRYILDNPEMFKDKSVCDFGAGSGIAGIAAKMAGAKKVTCVDRDPMSVIMSEQNAELNGVDLRYMWGTWGDIPRCDICMFSAFEYDIRNEPPFRQFLSKFDGTILYVTNQTSVIKRSEFEKLSSMDVAMNNSEKHFTFDVLVRYPD